MKITTLALLSALTLGVASTASAEIVYQDTFDNDGATNTGIGGELLTGARNGGTLMSDTGSLGASTNFGSHQSFAWTTNQFDLTAGFELDVVFTSVATGFPSYVYNFGIVDEVTATTGLGGDTGNLNGYLYNDNDINTVGFSAANRPFHTSMIEPGVYSDFGTLTALSGTPLKDEIALGTQQTLNLTVNADGSGSATLDGVTENFAAGTFSSLFSGSTDGEFHFVIYAQGNDDPGGALDSVTITTVPEPGSLALLGLGGLLIARRRRG